MIRDLFLFVPAYNVERELKRLLCEIPSDVLLRTEEIFIIDDGSSDATATVAKLFAESEIRTRVVVNSFGKNSGYGAVVKCGILRACELSRKSAVKFAICLHGDGQYDPKCIPKMLGEFVRKGSAIVQGSRHAQKGMARRGGMPLYKFFGGKFLTAIENAVFTNKLTDRHSGFLAYRTDFLQSLDMENLSASFDIDLEILAIADARRQKISEVPIETRYAGETSNLRVIPYGLRVLKIVLKMWRAKCQRF